MKKISMMAVVSVMVAASLGCNVEPASTLKDPIKAPVAVEEFPLSDGTLELKESSAFFWKLNMGESDSALASKYGNLFEGEQRKLARLEAKKAKAEKVVELLKPHRMKLEGLNSKISTWTKQLEKELAKPEGQRNLAKIEKLQKDIAKAEEDKKPVEAEIEKILAEGSNRQLWEDFGKIEEQLKQTMADADKVRQELEKYAEGIDKPAITVKALPHGEISVEIKEWEPTTRVGGDKEFSTAAGNIRNAVYKSRGGELSMEVDEVHTEKHPLNGVDVEVRHVYKVRIARFKYAQSKIDGIAYFIGDVERQVAPEMVDFCRQLKRDLVDAGVGAKSNYKEKYEPCLYRKGILKTQDKPSIVVEN